MEWKTEYIDKAVKALCHGINLKIEDALLNDIISLFNNGVLEYRSTAPRIDYSMHMNRMTISQCTGVYFSGKEKLVELESSLAAEKAKVERLEKQNAQMIYDGLNGIKTMEVWYRSGGRCMSKAQYEDLCQKLNDAKEALTKIGEVK